MRHWLVLLITGSILSPQRPVQGEEPPTPASVKFDVQVDVIRQELSPDFCWFHPRLAVVPQTATPDRPLLVLTLQKHLHTDDHYSGLYYMTSADMGTTWSAPRLPKELDWRPGPNNETIAVCDVTPGWHAASQRVLAMGIQLRYSAAGHQLLDQPRSHTWGYSSYDPATDKWAAWQSLELPEAEGKFAQVDPGCGQWIVQEDGTLLVPIYYQGREGGPYLVTVVHCRFDGSTLKYLAHGTELELREVRGLCEPSLVAYQGRYYLTIRNDLKAYVVTSADGLTYKEPLKAWTFDDGTDLGSYNTQAHWLVHSDGLFLAYTRRGAMNDHIPRNRAPIFLAQVDPDRLQVMKVTEQAVIPERGAMLGNFGATTVTATESWITDSEYIADGQAHPRGADGTTFGARIRWATPNRLAPDRK